MRKATTSRQSIAIRSLMTLTLVFSLLFATASSVFAADHTGTIGPGGATLSFGGGDVVVKAPDGATSTDVTVTYTALTAATAPASAPDGKAFGSQIFTLDTAGATFSQFVTVTVKYTAADKAAAGGRDDNVALYIYDAASGTWLENQSALPNVIDLTLTASQQTLGTYALVLSSGSAAPAPTTAPVDTTTPPDSGDFGVTTGMMLAMGLVGAFFVLGGGFMVVRGRNS